MIKTEGQLLALVALYNSYADEFLDEHIEGAATSAASWRLIREEAQRWVKREQAFPPVPDGARLIQEISLKAERALSAEHVEALLIEESERPAAKLGEGQNWPRNLRLLCAVGALMEHDGISQKAACKWVADHTGLIRGAINKTTFRTVEQVVIDRKKLIRNRK